MYACGASFVCRLLHSTLGREVFIICLSHELDEVRSDFHMATVFGSCVFVWGPTLCVATKITWLMMWMLSGIIYETWQKSGIRLFVYRNDISSIFPGWVQCLGSGGIPLSYDVMVERSETLQGNHKAKRIVFPPLSCRVKDCKDAGVWGNKKIEVKGFQPSCAMKIQGQMTMWDNYRLSIAIPRYPTACLW